MTVFLSVHFCDGALSVTGIQEQLTVMKFDGRSVCSLHITCFTLKR